MEVANDPRSRKVKGYPKIHAGQTQLLTAGKSKKRCENGLECDVQPPRYAAAKAGVEPLPVLSCRPDPRQRPRTEKEETRSRFLDVSC